MDATALDILVLSGVGAAWAGFTVWAIRQGAKQIRDDRERELELVSSLRTSCSWSPATDILTVSIRGAELDHCQASERSSDLILLCDHDGAIVGLQLCGAEEMGAKAWLASPARAELSEDLRRAVDRWVRVHVRDDDEQCAPGAQ